MRLEAGAVDVAVDIVINTAAEVIIQVAITLTVQMAVCRAGVAVRGVAIELFVELAVEEGAAVKELAALAVNQGGVVERAVDIHDVL